MSDQYGSYDNPYGVRPPFPPQPPYAPWQGPPPPPPGLYPPPQPSMQPSTQPPSHAGERRPGAVTTAAVLTFALSGLTLLVLVVGIIGVIAVRVDPGPDPDDAISLNEAVFSLIAIGVALVATVAAIVLAALALARRQGPRVTLVVLSFLYAALVLLVGVGLLIDGLQPATSAGEVVGGVVVLTLGLVPALCAILLLLPSAGRWYAGRVRR
ncbi:MAG: hypothetical protein ACXVDH_00640 [Nocardioides sp.]